MDRMTLIMALALAAAVVDPLGPRAVLAAEPASGVRLSASVFADFEASPTLDLGNPDLSGGTNVLVDSDWLEQASLSDRFHEIYEGSGESGGSRFEVDYFGSASLSGGGGLEVDLLAVDHRNASASWWTAGGGAQYFEWLELSGPTDGSGNYVVSFTTTLGSFTAQNTQPPGFDNIWRASARTTLVAEPLDQSFTALRLGAFADLTKGCASLADPPCFGHSRALTSAGQLTVPGSNPVLSVSHAFSVSGRSVDIDTGGATLQMVLPPGVTASAYQPVPEPSAALGGLVALAILGTMRRYRRRDGKPDVGFFGRTTRGIYQEPR